MTDISLFVGNPDAYAKQLPDGSYVPVRSELTPKVMADHLQGVQTVGTYVVWMDKARMFVFDIDSRDLQMAHDLANEARALGFQPGIEFSGRKGYHVWVVLDQWMPAHDVRRVAKHLASVVGFNGEVFPKQDAVRDLGSLVKLPMGVHAVTGASSRFLSEPGLDTAQTLTNALQGLPPEPVSSPVSGGGPLPCVDSIQTNPPGEGQRNNLYFHFACHLRRMGLHEDAVRDVLEGMQTGLPDHELDSIIVNSEFSGPTCDQVPPDRHCGSACVKQRAKGLSVRPGQLKRAIDDELVVVRVKGSGRVRTLEHPDAEEAKAMLRKDTV